MNLISVKQLTTHFQTEEGLMKAVDGVSFDVEEGKVLGLVGESGSGKTVTAYSLMGLFRSSQIARTQGEVWFEGVDLLRETEEHLRDVRGNRMAMIFQDPMTFLNPFLTVGTQLVEVLTTHLNLAKVDAWEAAKEMLESVGMVNANERMRQHPHEFSGGMRQRVMIAMALLCQPKLLIADEPTTALDVTIQAQILNLLDRLKEESKLGMILVTHDLGVVAGMADEVAVMYAGKIVEKGETEELFARARHPYTQALLKSVPDLNQGESKDLYTIQGNPPHLASLPSGCAFHPRCPMAKEQCRSEIPTLTAPNGRSLVSCWESGK